MGGIRDRRLWRRGGCAKAVRSGALGRSRMGRTPGRRAAAGVVELADTPDLGSGGASRGGSSPSARTTGRHRLALPSGWRVLRIGFLTMQVTETLSDGLKRGFTVVVPAADIESRAAPRGSPISAGRLRLPGFRPGKVPLPVVRQRYGTAVTAEVLEEAVNDATQQVLERARAAPGAAAEGRPGQPGLRPRRRHGPGVQGRARAAAGDRHCRISPASRLTRLKAEAADGDGGQGAGRHRARATASCRGITPEELGDRGAAKGEVLTVDYRRHGGRRGSSPAAAASDVPTSRSAAPGFIPGFTEQIEGLRPGETRVIDVTFPDPYMAARRWPARRRSSRSPPSRLQRVVATPIDDALAQKLGLRRRWTSCGATSCGGSSSEYDQLSRLRLKRELLDALAERSSFRRRRRAWCRRSSTRSGSAWRPTASRAAWTTTTRTRTTRR